MWSLHMGSYTNKTHILSHKEGPTNDNDKQWLYYNIMTQWQLDIKWQQGQKIKSIAKIFTAIILYLWKEP